jgi:tRNA-specific 2-thiouridylase
MALFTIGQRKGLSISSSTPLYVLGKDLARNALIVGPHDQVTSNQLIAKNVNWVAGAAPGSSFKAQVKIRYKANDIPCSVDKIDGDTIQVNLENPARDITPGQAAVLYNDEVCLGGGIITSEMDK